MFSSLSLILLSVSIGVLAAPTPRQLAPNPRADAVTSLSVNQLSTIVPFTQFARAAYCPPEKIQGWQCGGMQLFFMLQLLATCSENQTEACDALPGFNPTLTGGDGNAEQFCEFDVSMQVKAIVINLLVVSRIQSSSVSSGSLDRKMTRG